MANNSLGQDWKDTAVELGGAFVGLGKTLLKSVKAGVDIAYDYMNAEDNKNKQKKSSNSHKKTETTIIIEEPKDED